MPDKGGVSCATIMPPPTVEEHALDQAHVVQAADAQTAR
jgi:hypothetical protein